jgi:hypothetical protein
LFDDVDTTAQTASPLFGEEPKKKESGSGLFESSEDSLFGEPAKKDTSDNLFDAPPIEETKTTASGKKLPPGAVAILPVASTKEKEKGSETKEAKAKSKSGGLFDGDDNGSLFDTPSTDSNKPKVYAQTK